ncbi:MAG: NAD-dependent epimerase/dehydratase family protein [Alphaproteobacteria bacterium]
MKIAITGGAGFIGTQLAKDLKSQGHEVTLIDLQKSETFPGDSIIADISDVNAITEATKGMDAIYHLAAEHRDDVSPISRYTDINVEGGKNVIKAAKANGINRIIFSSTVAVYPLTPEDPYQGSNESHTPEPFNPYGESKWESEDTFREWAEQDKTRSLTIIRLVATFGVGNRGNIYNLINQIASGKFIMIGNGANQKSIAYVGNVAAFFAHALGFDKGIHLYNYADKPDLSMHDFVLNCREALGKSGVGLRLPYVIGLIGGYTLDIIAKITGRKFPISTIRVKKFCANTIVNADRVEETGFTRKYTLAEGLKEMIEGEFKGEGDT